MKRIFALAAIATMSFGCTTEEIDPTDYSTSPQNGTVVHAADAKVKEAVHHDVDLSQYIVAIHEETIEISHLYPRDDQIKAGVTLVFGLTPHTPEGLIAVIEEVAVTDDRIYYTYRRGQLDDVFDRLSYDISHYNTSQQISTRAEVTGEALGAITVEIEGQTTGLDITPIFGMNYEFVGQFDIDFEEQTLHTMTFGFRDAELEAGFNATIFAHAKGIGEVISPDIPLPPIQILVAEIPVIINSRLNVKASVEIDVKGGFDFDATVSSSPFDFVIDFGPQYDDYWDQVCLSGTPCHAEMDFDLNFNDVQGSAELKLTKQYAFEFTMYEMYEVLTLGTAVAAPEITFGTELIFEDEEAKAIITGTAGFPLEMGAEAPFLESIDLIENGAFRFTIPTVDIDLFTKELMLPCSILFDNSFASANCIVGADDNVELIHGLDANNGSPDGYKLNVDGREIGTFAYGSLHTTEIPASHMANVSTVSLRDADSPGCRVELTVINPCDFIAYCEDDPITDIEGQEYCYQTLADGHQWLNTNLLTSFGGTVGLCHGNIPNRCIEIGRYYQYAEMTSSICPSGWRIPSKEEWQTMLDSEYSLNGSGNFKVDHLLAPGLVNFGNIPEDATNGFNILPSGMYQGWKTDLPLSQRWSESLFDEGREVAYFWTSTPLSPDDANAFNGEGAWAVYIYSTGQYGFQKVSKSAGLTCRCIN